MNTYTTVQNIWVLFKEIITVIQKKCIELIESGSKDPLHC